MVAPDLSSKELGKRTEWPKKGVNLGSKNLSNNILNLCKYTLLKTKTYANILHLLMRLYLRLQRAQTNPKVHHIKHVLRYWFKLRPVRFGWKGSERGLFRPDQFGPIRSQLGPEI